MLASKNSTCAVKFLIGMNGSYSNIKSQFLLQKPLPVISSIYSYCWMKRVILQPHDLDSMTMLATYSENQSANMAQGDGPKYANKGKDRPYCTHCGQNGHTKDSGFQLHGFPPGWKDKKN